MHISGYRDRNCARVDIGHRQAGVETVEEALELARLASRLPGVTYEGIMGYERALCFYRVLGRAEKKVSSIAYDRLLEYRMNLVTQGFLLKIVAPGGTGTYLLIAGEQRGNH